MALIYTDRSRQESGLQVCLRKRYWEFHSVTGFGIRLKQQSLPLTTGIHVHGALAEILGIVKLMGPGATSVNLNDPAFRLQVREAIAHAQARYRAETKLVGFVNEAPTELERIITEQCVLLEGLVWGWVRTHLNDFLRDFMVLDVEQEESYVVGCSCGIGDGQGEVEHHEAKDCEGVCQQSKPDIVCFSRELREVGIHDFKTMKYLSDYEVERYKNSVQMAVGTLGVERRLGRPVTHYYVWPLIKGDRKGEYNPTTRAFDKPKIQLSPFTYVGYTAANPPLRPETLNFDEKWYKRSPTWAIKLEGKPAEASNIEYLVMDLMQERAGLEVLQKQFSKVGPYTRQGMIIRGYMNQVYWDEKRWAELQWRIWDDTQAGMSLADALDKHVPASWNCRKYGELCPFWSICAQDGATPEDPLRSGQYVLRVPHHEPELKRVIAAGIELPKVPTVGEEG